MGSELKLDCTISRHTRMRLGSSEVHGNRAAQLSITKCMITKDGARMVGLLLLIWSGGAHSIKLLSQVGEHA